MKLARIAAAGVIALTIALAPHPAAAGTAEAGAMAAVNQFIAAFNSGDQKAIVDACTAQAAIIDDFPPHLWSDCGTWILAFNEFAKANAITDGKVTVGTPWHVAVTGNIAYIVLPATFTYKQNGKPVVESGSVWTLRLKKSSAGWRVTAWAWAQH